MKECKEEKDREYTKKQYLERLLLFNKKAERLYDVIFMNKDFLKSPGELDILIEKIKSKNVFNFPIENLKSIKIGSLIIEVESIESIVLSLRFFIQDNEESSLCRLKLAYDHLNIEFWYKSEFYSMRNRLNKHLDEKESMVANRNQTRREVMNIFIFGQYAHANKKYELIIEDWNKNVMVIGQMQTIFHLTLIELVMALQIIKVLNYEVISTLDAKTNNIESRKNYQRNLLILRKDFDFWLKSMKLDKKEKT